MASSPVDDKSAYQKLAEENQRLKQEIERLRTEIARLKSIDNRGEGIAASDKDFLAVLSHEIRTPLNVILGLSDLLLQHDPREDQLTNLRSLHFSADNMLNLVNNILDFNKFTHQKLLPKCTDFNLRETIEDLKYSYVHMAEKGNNQLYFEIDANIPDVVRGDRLKLIQVISNLLNNALKFTDNGIVLLTVRIDLILENTVDVFFSVSDTGPGISRDNLDLIFERFRRTEDSVTQRVGGTGLGLFMVDQLLRIMDSQIHVESTLGKGSRFYFNISFQRILKEARQSAIEANNNSDIKKKKVLLAEDMKEHRDVLSQYFGKWQQVDAKFVQNGTQVLECLRENKYDVIFLDIKMPELNGHETVRKIRNMKGKYFANVPVIALTADVFSTNDESGGLFTDILTKPFKFSELKEKILLYTE